MEIKGSVSSNKFISYTLMFVLCLALLTVFSGCATPLGSAAGKGDLNTVSTLIKSGADVNEKDYDSHTALYYAASTGQTEVVRLLIEKGADVDEKGPGWTPLVGAAYYGYANTAKILLDSGADVNGRGNPLEWSVRRGHTEVTRLLIDAGADINGNYLNIAQKRGYTTIALMLERALEERYLIGKKSASTAPQKVAVTFPTAPLSATPADLTVASLDFGSYHALVIGNNDYQSLPKLRTPINDARSMADLLEAKYGFKVRRLLNASRIETLKAIYSYRRTLTSRDNLLIYYAGHGWLDKEADEGYWLPVDAESQDPGNWISNSTITSSLRAMRAKHVLVVADSCYSGKLARGISVRLRTSDYYQRISRKKARSVLASGGLEPVADAGGKGEHSVFASALIEALNENQGVLDATLLFSKIRRPVMVNADQTPEYSDIRKAGHDGGDFLFVPR